MNASSIELDDNHRRASPDDASALAELVNMAGEGMPLYLWTQLAGPDESAWDVGRKRARRDHGGFSYRNAVVRERDGAIVACLVGYPLADDVAAMDTDDVPAMFVPLIELENLAAGTWYVNVLATYPEHRGMGFASELLGIARRLADATGRNGLSLIVADGNGDAIRLYEKSGFKERARRAMVKERWQSASENWILMTTDRP